MIARPCPRCHTRLEFEDSSLVFCFHCGAPQVLLGQELRELAEQQQGPSGNEAQSPAAAPEDPTLIQWRPMLRLAGAVSACFAVVAFVLAPLSLLVPAITLSLYSSRYRQARITAGLGARIGLLCGLIVAAIVSTVGALSSLVVRLRSHGVTSVDQALNAQFQQVRDQLAAQHVPDVASTTSFLNIPEFRAGLMLCGAAMAITFFLATISAAGALAGYVRSRSSSRPAL